MRLDVGQGGGGWGRANAVVDVGEPDLGDLLTLNCRSYGQLIC